MRARTELRVLHALRAFRGGMTGRQVSRLSGVARWSGSVYVHLARLAEEGLVESQEVRATHGPLIVYRLTGAGWDRLRELYREEL